MISEMDYPPSQVKSLILKLNGCHVGWRSNFSYKLKTILIQQNVNILLSTKGILFQSFLQHKPESKTPEQIGVKCKSLFFFVLLMK